MGGRGGTGRPPGSPRSHRALPGCPYGAGWVNKEVWESGGSTAAWFSQVESGSVTRGLPAELLRDELFQRAAASFIAAGPILASDENEPVGLDAVGPGAAPAEIPAAPSPDPAAPDATGLRGSGASVPTRRPGRRRR